MTAKTFEDGEVRISDSRGIDKNGQPAHYVVHIAPVHDENGEITHVIEMSYDVTESRFLQTTVQPSLRKGSLLRCGHRSRSESRSGQRASPKDVR